MELWMHGAFAVSALVAFAVAIAPGDDASPTARQRYRRPDRGEPGRPGR